MRKFVVVCVLALAALSTGLAPAAGTDDAQQGAPETEGAAPVWVGTVDVSIESIGESDEWEFEEVATSSYSLPLGTAPTEPGFYSVPITYDYWRRDYTFPPPDACSTPYISEATGATAAVLTINQWPETGDVMVVVSPTEVYGTRGFEEGCGDPATSEEYNLFVGGFITNFDEPGLAPIRDPITDDVLVVGQITEHRDFDDGSITTSYDETWDVNLRCLAPCPVEVPSTCDGLEYTEVLGPTLAYGPSSLAEFPNSDQACDGFWLPYANDGFVPQGLALAGGTAWVSGYRFDPIVGEERCRLVRVDLDTGDQLTGVRGISTNFGGSRTWCKHGGGLARTSHGLWLADTRHLWLLNPARVGVSNPVIRVWSLANPVKGSFLVEGNANQIGVGVFNDTGPGKVHWFRFSDLMRPGVTRLLKPGTARTASYERRAVRSDPAPRRAQGGVYRPGGVFTSSTAGCGMIVWANGTRSGFGPGAEELAFTSDGDLWAVFESGAEPYQQLGRPHVPMLVRFDEAGVRSGAGESCSW